MAFTAIPGLGPLVPLVAPLISTYASPVFASAVIDATGEKIAFVGRFWHPDRVTKNIRRVGFSFGTVTKAGGSALTISLQDVSLTTAPMQPDGVQDQTVAVANADAGFTSNAWYRSGTLSADRTVAIGEPVAMVIEYDGGGRLSSDVVNLRGIASGSSPLKSCAFSLQTGGTWAFQSILPNVVFECDDGTFGTVSGAYVWSAVNSPTFASNTAGADEYALEFTPTVPVKVDGLFSYVSGAAGAEYDLVLYDGTTPLATVTMDKDWIATSGARPDVVPIAEQTLTPGTIYRVAVKPTTTTAVGVTSIDVNDALHWKLHEAGPGFNYTTRVDAGAWAAATTTRRLLAGVRVSAAHDGAGGGGVLINPGLSGGLR